MVIERITIQNLGAIGFYQADLTGGINRIESRYAQELAAVIGFLLHNHSAPGIPEQWLRRDTWISAVVSLGQTTCSVSAKPVLGQLQLLVTDPSGANVTDWYQYILSHCAEQDDIEIFDGQKKTMPMCLCRYWLREESDLSDRTYRIVDTESFHRYLCQYIQDFRPQSIHSQKAYQAVVDPQGKFEAKHPEYGSKVFLSETEEKLFSYICFLNVAEFWAGFERIRDLHHEKKTLLIHNFLEFLDESVNVSGLIERTEKLDRQIIFLCHAGKELKYAI